jgi:hypothetical protein
MLTGLDSVSFIMVEIVRRGRFRLQPYAFECPKSWRLHDAYDSAIQKMKTVQLDHGVPLFPGLSLFSYLPRLSSVLSP